MSKSVKKNRQHMRLFKTVWISMIILISVILAQYSLIGINDLLAIGRSEERSVTIEIPKNSGVARIAEILQKKGVIDNKQFFELYARFTKASKNFISGNFEIKTNMDYEAIINYIQSNNNRLEKDLISLTFPEGLTVLEYADLLEQNEVCDKSSFLELCNSDTFDKAYSFLTQITNKSERYYKLEGYLFPDTYIFYKNENAKDTIRRFLNNYEDKIVSKKKVEGYDNKISIEEIAVEKGFTPENLLTLASMIQLEAANEDDMPNVSSVFHNRLSTLNNGGVSPYGDSGLSLLASDVTVWYPYRTKSKVPVDLVDSFKSNYNTYNIKGLPPGPVCNPGMDAIDAALNPNDTSYYYFCHSKDKKAYYAKTFNDHQKNLYKAGLIS